VRVRTRILRHVFHELTSLYLESSDDHFAALCFENLDEAHEVVDRLVLGYVHRWPQEAKQQLGIVLGASLLHRRVQLIGALTPSNWSDFRDPADALFGYVFWQLFPDRSLTSFADTEITWDSGPIDDFLDEHGPLPAHDWSEFSKPLRR